MKYIRPKFKISQKIWVITKDTIKEVEVESIQSHGDKISYLSNNHLFKEDNCFPSKEEAEDFMENSIMIPEEHDFMWSVDHRGIHLIKIIKATCFFKNDLKKPYNMTCKTDRCINESGLYENIEDAIAAFKMNYVSKLVNKA